MKKTITTPQNGQMLDANDASLIGSCSSSNFELGMGILEKTISDVLAWQTDQSLIRWFLKAGLGFYIR